MSSLLRRIRPRRAAGHDPAPAETTAAATPGEHREDPPRALPAGTDPERVTDRRNTGRRGAARRRLRHLRRVRELLLRDLGGYVYELHRAGSAATAEHGVLTGKLERLSELDAERADLEERVGDRSGELLLREPGIGGRCPTCGELHGSEARFCSSCGMALVPGAARPRPALGPGADAEAAASAPGALAAGAAPASETLVPGAHVAEPLASEPAVEAPPDAHVVEGEPAAGDQPAEPLPAVEPRPADWLPAEEPRR